jgi:hypothetical protein
VIQFLFTNHPMFTVMLVVFFAAHFEAWRDRRASK